MNQTQHLPIYSLAYGFAKELYRIKLKLPKALKHDLGKESCESALKILKCIVAANGAQEKTPYILKLLFQTEAQWVFIRLLYDFHGITEGEFRVLSERLSEIEKQAQAWLKWQQNSKSTVCRVPKKPLSFDESSLT